MEMSVIWKEQKKEVLRAIEINNWGTGHFLDAAKISLGGGIVCY